MDQSLVSVNPAICGGAPCIAGTRIPVSTILNRLAAGDSIADILQSYTQLRREQVVAAIEYTIARLRDEEIELTNA